MAPAQPLPDNYPELLVEMHRVLLFAINQHELSHAPDEAALLLTETIRKHFGGISLYIPKGSEIEVTARHREIYSRYNYRNAVELAKEYKLSVQCIYRIVKYIGKLESTRRNMDVFSIS